jgi:hypothetical protein
MTTDAGTAMPIDSNPLQAEISAFERMRPELEKNFENKFVVFRGTELAGSWDSFAAAGSDAIRRFGRGPFLIRQVVRKQHKPE